MDSESSPRSPLMLYTSVAIGILAISFSSILIKWTSAPPAIIGMYRLLFSVIILVPWLWREKHSILMIQFRDWFLLGLSGVFLGLHFLFWIASLNETTVASSMIITSLSPLIVVIGAFLMFQERLNKKEAISMVLALLGIIIVGYGDIGHSSSHIMGDVSSLIGTFALGVYMLLGQAVRTKISSTLYNISVFFVASFELAIYSGIKGIRFFGYPHLDWFLFVLLAIVPTLFGHGLFNWLLKYISATTVSMTTLGEPIGASILAYVLLGQQISWWQLIGGIASIGGVFLFLQSKRRNVTK